MLELVELRGFDQRKPGQISGGQAQRVALARALINRPAVLLLDEPLGALDLKLRKQMQIELKRIQQEVGITFIYVTHDQEEAMTMSDRIAVMNRGRYEQLGSPEELYERPATRFVASFLGASNLLHGKVEGTRRRLRHGPPDGSTHRARAARLLDGPDRGRRRRAAGEDPPRWPERRRERPAGAERPDRPRRSTLAYTGVSTQYQVELRTVRIVAVYEQNLERATSGSLHRPGDEVRLTWSPDDTFAVEPARRLPHRRPPATEPRPAAARRRPYRLTEDP